MAIPRKNLVSLIGELCSSCEKMQNTSNGMEDNDEIDALHTFSVMYQHTRDFTNHASTHEFIALFNCLLHSRLLVSGWMRETSRTHVYHLLVCLRVFLRDRHYLQRFIEHGALTLMSQFFADSVSEYFGHSKSDICQVETLTEITNICQKLSAVEANRDKLVASKIHESLVLLLSSADLTLLHCSLHALTSLSQSEKPRQSIGQLNTVEALLAIIHNYDPNSKKLAANLLKILCVDASCRNLTTSYGGIPILLSQLHSTDGPLLIHVVWCLVQLCSDVDTSNALRHAGALPLLLSILQLSNVTPGGTNVGPSPALLAQQRPADSRDQPCNVTLLYSIKTACCACLTELVLNDTNAHETTRANGIYCIASLILPISSSHLNPLTKLQRSIEKLQRSAFRTLRFLFSMERNRRLFKRLFPPDLFEKFIDVGHYNRDLSAYRPLVEMINSYPEAILLDMRQNIGNANQHKMATHNIGNYAVFEWLGSGSFGSVYKVRKRDAGQSFMAMKEINYRDSTFGMTRQEQDESVGHMMSELSIIRQELRHPNIVRYYKTFTEGEKLYIVMELVEGTSLHDCVASLKEKGGSFGEARFWKITMQMMLALRYLHKEKRIVHRDLSPNNVMIGHNDRVTITDFGLAKQKRGELSDMTSTVGTILYSCPEVLQNYPYGEKADIWSLGCLLYQMATLEPPFYSTNIVALTRKIVEAEYRPIPDGVYSRKLIETAHICLTRDASSRPDIIELGRSLVDVMLVHMDHLVIQEHYLERKLSHEQQRTRRHFSDSCSNIHRYRQLFLASQPHKTNRSSAETDGGWSSDDDEECLYRDDGCVGCHDGTLPAPPDEDVPLNQRLSVHIPKPHFLSPDSGNSSADLSPCSPALKEGKSHTDSVSATLKHGSIISTKSTRKRSPDSVFVQLSSLVTARRDEIGAPVVTTREPLTNEGSAAICSTRTGLRKSQSSGNIKGNDDINRSRKIPETSHNNMRNKIRAFSAEGGNGANVGLLCVDNAVLSKPCGYHRSQSTSVIELRARSASRHQSSPGKTAKLTIASHKLREVTDPIQQILHQIHKIIYISQLPPSLTPDRNRHMVEKFKKSLFSRHSTSLNLKTELKKVMEGSRDIIDLSIYPLSQPTATIPGINNADCPETGSETESDRAGVTYEQMHALIESTLLKCGYYDVSHDVPTGQWLLD